MADAPPAAHVAAAEAVAAVAVAVETDKGYNYEMYQL